MRMLQKVPCSLPNMACRLLIMPDMVGRNVTICEEEMQGYHERMFVEIDKGQ